jgi:hypothetical protein
MQPTLTRTGGALMVMLGMAACADTSTPNLMQQQPRYGSTQEDRFVTERARTGAGVQAPIVRGTGQITGGLGSAEVQRVAPAGPGAERQGVVPFMGGEDQLYYVPTAQAAQYQRRARQSQAAAAAAAPAAGATAAAATTGRPPSTEEVLQFSRTLDRAQAHLNARRNTAAVNEIERAETMVVNARTRSQPYEAALRDLSTARQAAGRGDSRAANEALDALKSRLAAPT